MLVVAACTVVGALVIAQPAAAAGADGVYTVSPPLQRVDVSPGGQASASIRIANQSNQTRTFVIRFDDVAPPDRPDDDKQIVDAGDASRGAAQWASTRTPTLRLAPGEVTRVTLTITAPDNAAPGGYALAVIARDDVPAQAGVDVSLEVASIVLVDVAGQAKRQVTARWHNVPRISFGNPIDVTLRFTNAGTENEIVAGAIVIARTPGSATRASTDPMVLLPEATRDRSMRMSLPWYPHVATLRWNSAPDAAHTRVAAQRIVVVQWWWLVAVGAGLVLAIAWRRRKSHQLSDDFSSEEWADEQIP